MKKKSTVVSLSSVIEEIIEKLKPEADSWFEVLKSNWQNIVGNDIAKNTKPVKIEESVLFVKVSSHIWKAELKGGLGNVILKRVQKDITNKIKKIRWM